MRPPSSLQLKRDSRQQRKLLLVEDDSSVVASLRLFLKSDYEVHSASTVSSGFHLFTTLQPSLVVLDLRLADGDGLEVLRKIRSVNPLAPVIVLTGYASMDTAEEALRLGASDYLHKPFDGQMLRSRIRQLTASAPSKHAASDDISEAVLMPLHKIAALERKAQGSAMFLHDAANPVTTALTATQFLCDAIENTPELFSQELRDTSDLLYGAMGFLCGLFEQSGSIECMRNLETSEVPIYRIVDLTVKMVNTEAQKRKITLAVHVKNREAIVCVNRFAVARVLLNLLRNAIAAVKPQTGRVVLMADIIDDFVEFSVIDNGPGIPPKYMEQIFEANFTTKAEGTGIGLYICKCLVENMGGTLSVRNEPKQGCCFSLRIPCIYE